MRTVFALLVGISGLLSFASARTPVGRFVNSALQPKLKRQTSDEVDECVNERLAVLQSNPECYQAVLRAEIDNGTAGIGDNSFFSAVCKPNCGLPYLDILDDCDAFDVNPDLQDSLIGLCESDSNGRKCYEHFDTYFNNTFECLVSPGVASGSCLCMSQLEQTARQIGCCLNTFNNLFSSLNFNLTEFYTDTCGVAVPKACNNSTLDVQACAERKLRAVLQPSSDCYRQASKLNKGGIDLTSQGEINSVYSALCQPNCSRIFVDARKECGRDDGGDFLVCETDLSGRKCYENLASNLDFFVSNPTGLGCIISSATSLSCQCKSQLEQVANKSGCCLSSYNDFLLTTTDFNTTSLFTDLCRVAVPGNCSSLSSVPEGSLGIAVSTWVVLMAALLSVIFL